MKTLKYSHSSCSVKMDSKVSHFREDKMLYYCKKGEFL